MPEALVMTTSTTGKLHKPRRKSVEDYQKRIVDRIKNHFQKNREEWESNLLRKTHNRNSNPLKTDVVKSLEMKCEHGLGTETQCKLCMESEVIRTQSDSKGDRALSKSPSVRITSCNIVNTNSSGKTMQLEVDISEFLPNGEVTFRTEKDSLSVCAKYPCPDAKDKSIQKVKSIPIPGLIETERIRVIPSNGGAMILQLKVAKH